MLTLLQHLLNNGSYNNENTSLFFSFSLHATTDSWNVVICDSCESENASKQAALSVGEHRSRVIVFNMEARAAYAFSILDFSEPGFSLRSANPIPLPEGADEAIDVYNELQIYLRTHDDGSFLEATNFYDNPAYLLNSLPNGCGSPSAPFLHAVLELTSYPFTPACNSHDVCYTSHRTKQSCDAQFLKEMQDIIKYQVNVLTPNMITAKVVDIALHAKALAYYNAVKHSSIALDAYCNNTLSFSPECGHGFDERDGMYTGTASESLIQGTMSGFSYIMQCELWQFPDGNGSVYYMERNCSFITWSIP